MESVLSIEGAIIASIITLVPVVFKLVKAWMEAGTRKAESLYRDHQSIAPADTLRTHREAVKADLGKTLAGQMLPSGVLDKAEELAKKPKK